MTGGDAATPAAHRMLRASIRSPPTITPSASHAVTGFPTRTSTPSLSCARFAAADDLSEKAGSSLSPASMRMTRAWEGLGSFEVSAASKAERICWRMRQRLDARCELIPIVMAGNMRGAPLSR